MERAGSLDWRRTPPSVVHQLAALLMVAAATLAGAWLEGRYPHAHPSCFYFPAVLGAALLGGWSAGLTALAASAALNWGFFIAQSDMALDVPSSVAVAIYIAAASTMVLAGAQLRTVLADLRDANQQLAERELRYRTLFDAVSEGFALVEAIRDAHGKLVDYVVLEANPAVLRMLNIDAGVVGRRQSEILGGAPESWLAACDRALKGQPVSFEYFGSRRRRWFEIHFTRINDEQLGQFIIDITDRKLAETRQSELFDELNHRVKNNLAMVSSMLAMQARTAEPQVRDHLARAVDRIQTIADVHASLYRSSRKDDVDFAAYLQDLCSRLAGSLVEDERVRLEVSADPATLPLDKAVALGVVVNELVTNAAKHAYPAPAAGAVRIALRREAMGLVLSVSDDGAGLPQAPCGGGLGMRLVRSLVQQIGGVLEVGPGPGALFRIVLPEPA